MAAVDKEAAGSASGALNLASQVASVLGIAIIGSMAMARIGALGLGISAVAALFLLRNARIAPEGPAAPRRRRTDRSLDPERG
jgi:hypothetical protein